jgi:hypothetical protein
MMQMTFSAIVEEFDSNKYLEALRKEVRRVFLKAGQRFLITTIPKIPVWTGMARGAFRNAEDVFGKVTSDITSGFRIRTTRGKGEKRGGGSNNYVAPGRRGYYYYPPGGSRILRTPQAGRQFATPPEQILNLNGASLASGRTAFYFRFKVDITYFNILDSAKWQAFKAGSDAVEAYVRANLKPPNPLEFMTRKVVK